MVTLLFTSVGRAMGWLRKQVQQGSVGSLEAVAQPQTVAATLTAGKQLVRRGQQMPASAVPFVTVAKEVYPELGVAVKRETAKAVTNRRCSGRSALCGRSTEILAQPSTRVNRPSAGQARRALLAPRTSLHPRKTAAPPQLGPAPEVAAPKSSTIPVDPIFGVWPRRPRHPWN